MRGSTGRLLLVEALKPNIEGCQRADASQLQIRVAGFGGRRADVRRYMARETQGDRDCEQHAREVGTKNERVELNERSRDSGPGCGATAGGGKEKALRLA